MLQVTLISGRRGARHVSMMSSLGRIVGPIKSGHLDEQHALGIVEAVVRQSAPDRLGTFYSAWSWCLRMTTPRGPRTDDTIAEKFLDRTDRQALAVHWFETGPCSDPKITTGGTRGANALAIAVHFAVTSMRVGSTLLSESHAQIGEAVCMGSATVWRCGELLGPHIPLVSKGHLSREAPHCKMSQPCPWCASSNIRPGEAVASLWRLHQSVPDVKQPEGQRDDPCRDVSHQGQIVHVPLGESIALPWADRWVRRKGGRQEWRLWLALADDDALTHGQLVQATGLGKNQVSEYVHLMGNAGEIAETDPGRYIRLHGLLVVRRPRQPPHDPLCALSSPFSEEGRSMSLFDAADCGEPDSPLVWETAGNRRYRQLRVVVVHFHRRTLRDFQVTCPRCGAGVGQPCVRPSGVELRYVSSGDEGHHSERVPSIPRNGWATR